MTTEQSTNPGMWQVRLCTEPHPKLTDAELIAQFEAFLSNPFSALMARGIRKLKGFYDEPDWWIKEKQSWTSP